MAVEVFFFYLYIALNSLKSSRGVILSEKLYSGNTVHKWFQEDVLSRSAVLHLFWGSRFKISFDV